MPRLQPRLLQEAAKIHRFLPLLLSECRTISDARQEFTWLKKELKVDETSHYSLKKLQRACIRRHKHVPLQYILGTQPFGNLNILCKPKVLIPRWETEEWSFQLGNAIKEYCAFDNGLIDGHIVDLCTGTGCIPLLLRDILSEYKNLQYWALDTSPHAVFLAGLNDARAKLSKPHLPYLNLLQRDVLDNESIANYIDFRIDLLTCNPPYIPQDDYVRDVRSSVKLYEPKLALVGNMEFYINLVNFWLMRTNSFVYEIGRIEQFEYVKDHIVNHPELNKNWAVGLRFDSSGKPRCVYGFNIHTDKLDMKRIFKHFGQLFYMPYLF